VTASFIFGLFFIRETFLLLVQSRRGKTRDRYVSDPGQVINWVSLGGFQSRKVGHDSLGVFGGSGQVHFNALPYVLILYTVSHFKRLDNPLSWLYFVDAIY
jgi:hypothetical protein